MPRSGPSSTSPSCARSAGCSPRSWPAAARPGTEGTSGAHLHQSLLSDGENAFAGDRDGLSETGRHYLGGMLATLPEMHVVFRPTVNSYRRVNREEWSPVEASWGHDTRTCAIRAITVPAPSGVRFEHRVAGADVNPHLVARDVPRRAACTGSSTGSSRARRAPATRAPRTGATRALARDPARLGRRLRALGVRARSCSAPSCTRHYADSRRAEWDAFQGWLAATSPRFEFARYFEAH